MEGGVGAAELVMASSAEAGAEAAAMAGVGEEVTAVVAQQVVVEAPGA